MADDWHPGKAFVRAIIKDLVPKVESSAFFLSLCPGDDSEGDVKFWVELGLAIMLDKPIISVVPYAERDKRKIPQKLRRISDAIIYAPDGMNEVVADQLQVALHAMVTRKGMA